MSNYKNYGTTLLARMSDLSEFMKTVKQRFSIWYNRNHGNRKGTLWMDRFKSVLVEDPKDYRFCGYAEAVAGEVAAKKGLIAIWADRGAKRIDSALRAHRSLIFGKRASDSGLPEMTRQQALKVLDADGQLSKAAMLRCRVRYFTDGAFLGSAEFVRGFTDVWQVEGRRKHPPKVNAMRGDWGGLAVIQGLRRQVFG